VSNQTEDIKDYAESSKVAAKSYNHRAVKLDRKGYFHHTRTSTALQDFNRGEIIGNNKTHSMRADQRETMKPESKELHY